MDLDNARRKLGQIRVVRLMQRRCGHTEGVIGRARLGPFYSHETHEAVDLFLPDDWPEDRVVFVQEG